MKHPIPHAPERPSTARRHTVATMTIARTMYADGEGWTPTQIARYLADHGTFVSVPSVRDWVIPGLAEHRSRGRKARRIAAAAERVERPPGRDETPEETAFRLRVDYGMSYKALSIMLREYHGVEMTEDRIRHRLTAMGAPRNPNKART